MMRFISTYARDRSRIHKQLKEEAGILGKNLQYYFSSTFCHPFAVPDNATIHVTYGCNLQCPICEIINIPKRDELSSPKYDLTLAELRSIIKQVKAMGIRELMLTGGEPFLRSDLPDIAALCVEQGLAVDITTNATLIDEAVARKIAASGVRHIQVSIDSINPDTNDLIRGRKGAFRKAVAGIAAIGAEKAKIAKARNDRPTVGVNTVVLDTNLEELPAMARFFKNMEVVQIVFLTFAADTSNLQHVNTQTSFWPKEDRLSALDAAVDDLVKLKQEDRHFINPHQPEEYLLLLKQYYRRTIKVSRFRCLSGFNRVVIGPNGDVASCGGNLGNLRNNDLRRIWYSGKARQARKKVKHCKNPCLQVCMGRSECENVLTIARSFIQRVKKLW